MYLSTGILLFVMVVSNSLEKSLSPCITNNEHVVRVWSMRFDSFIYTDENKVIIEGAFEFESITS